MLKYTGTSTQQGYFNILVHSRDTQIYWYTAGILKYTGTQQGYSNIQVLAHSRNTQIYRY